MVLWNNLCNLHLFPPLLHSSAGSGAAKATLMAWLTSGKTYLCCRLLNIKWVVGFKYSSSVPFWAVLLHLAQMEQYFDMNKKPSVWEGEANIWITVVVNMVTPGHGNWSKKTPNRFNLSIFVLQCRTSQGGFHPWVQHKKQNHRNDPQSFPDL